MSIGPCKCGLWTNSATSNFAHQAGAATLCYAGWKHPATAETLWEKGCAHDTTTISFYRDFVKDLIGTKAIKPVDLLVGFYPDDEGEPEPTEGDD